MKYEGRPNIGLAKGVEDALKTVDTCGRRHAARLMSAQGVPFSVTMRVLAEPDKRRNFNETSMKALFHLTEAP